MSIERRRTEQLVRDIIYGYISEGTYPPLHVVLRDLARQRRDNIWKELPYTERGIIMADPVNQAVDTILESLSLLYKELYSLYEEYEDFQTLARNEYRKIATLEKKLSVMLDDIIHSSSAGTSAFHSWGDSFNDLSKVDQTLTTAQIRLESGEAHLHLNLGASKEMTKEQIAAAAPSVTVENAAALISEEVITYVSDAFSKEGGAWIHEVKTSENMGVRLSLSISSTLAAINHVEVEPYSIRPMLITCYGVREGGNVSWGKSSTTTGRVSFGGIPENVSSILLDFYKDHYDFVEQGPGGLRYVYRLGASEIILRSEDYETSCDVVSIPITIPEEAGSGSDLSSVSLEVDENIPIGTKINYFLGIEPDETPTEIERIIWNPISPANKQREEDKAKTFFLYPGSSSNEVVEPGDVLGELVDIGVYRMTDDPDTEILLRSLNVCVGWDQALIWRNDSYDPKFTALEEWSERYTSDEIYGAYLDISALGDLYLRGQYSFLVEVPVIVDAPTSTTTSLYVPTGWECVAFVNGDALGAISTSYNTSELSLVLKRGTNWIHLAIITDGNNGHLRFGTDLSSIGRTYLWNPPPTDRDQIGKASDYRCSWDGGLLINFDPATTNPDPNPFDEDAGYYGVTHMPRVWFSCYEPMGERTDTIRFRAQLQRDPGTQASPALKEYHLRMKYHG